MFSLTEEQIAFIENDIKVRGITSPDLGIDLLDHICCLMENTLDGYRNFDTVYHETLLLFGEKGLKEIQDETNRLLTFKHYYIMNSTMKISGYISSVMILFGAFFKFNHWPGASMLMVVGVFFFTVLFLPLLFILKFKSNADSNRNVTLSIIGFISALLICCGILFRIMHWPGSQILIVSGAILLLLGYLPVYLISVYKKTTDKINATATVIVIIAAVGLFVTESGMTGLARPTSDSFWRGIIENDRLLTVLKKQNEVLYSKCEKTAAADSSLSSDQMHLIKSASDDLINYMDAMKTYLIVSTEQIPEEQAKVLNLDELKTSGGNDIIHSILLAESNSNYSAANLKSKIEAYKQSVSKFSKDIDLSLLETQTLNVYGEQVSWEKSNFDQLPISLVIFNITRIQLAVETTETAMLNHL